MVTESCVSDMDNSQEPETEETPAAELPAELKFLRLLVTGLTGTMIVGLLVLIAVIVIRFNDKSLEFPETLVLPDGVTAEAYTQTKRWQAVVTEDDRVLIYSRATGELSQVIELQHGAE